MANYRVVLQIPGVRLEAVRKKLVTILGTADHPAIAHVAKLDQPSSRAERLAEVQQSVEDAIGEIDNLQQEMQDWYDNMPENLQSSTKGEEVEAAAQQLADIKDGLESVDWEVNFPGMMG